MAGVKSLVSCTLFNGCAESFFTPATPATKCQASAGVKGQTEQVLKKIDDLLKAAGTDKSKLLSATIFLADIRGFDEMNAAWDAWVVAGSTPGRATVEARLANSKFLVEIVAIAAV